MQTAAGHRVSHIRAELAVGCAGVHIGATRPVAERVDLRIGINLAQMLCLGIALTENEPVTVQNVLPIIGIHGENVPCDLRELFLLLGHGHSFEDAVVTAADTVCLVIGEVTVLRYFHIVHGKVSGNAVNYGGDICLVQHDGSFRNNVAHAVADEYLHSDAGIFCFLVCQVNERTGNSVCHLVRVAGIYFFKHGVTPFSHGAGAPSGHPAALTRRIPCCSFLSRSGKSHSRAEPPGSCS